MYGHTPENLILYNNTAIAICVFLFLRHSLLLLISRSYPALATGKLKGRKTRDTKTHYSSFVCLLWTCWVCPNRGLFRAAFLSPPFLLFIWLFQKSQRGSSLAHHLGELVTLQSSRCLNRKASRSQQQGEGVLSIIVSVRREEGARRRESWGEE